MPSRNVGGHSPFTQSAHHLFKIKIMQYENTFINMLLSLKDDKGDSFYKDADIFDFKSLPNGSPILQYTCFIYNNIFHKDERFRIEKENFELFLTDKGTVDAFACSQQQHKIIVINLGLLNVLEKGVKECCQNLDETIKEILAKDNKMSNAESLVFRFITFFVFFHELGHLIQYKNSSNEIGQKKEKYNLTNSNSYSELMHLMEIDADLFAAQNLANFIIHSWQQLPSELKSTLAIDTMIALGTASIFLLFFELNDRVWPDMYFFSFCHPHPTIRISYIVDLMNKHVANHFQSAESNHEPQLVKTFEMASALINTEEKNAFKGYQMQYSNSTNKIDRYIKTLSSTREKYKQLIQNYN